MPFGPLLTRRARVEHQQSWRQPISTLPLHDNEFFESFCSEQFFSCDLNPRSLLLLWYLECGVHEDKKASEQVNKQMEGESPRPLEIGSTRLIILY